MGLGTPDFQVVPASSMNSSGYRKMIEGMSGPGCARGVDWSSGCSCFQGVFTTWADQVLSKFSRWLLTTKPYLIHSEGEAECKGKDRVAFMILSGWLYQRPMGETDHSNVQSAQDRRAIPPKTGRELSLLAVRGVGMPMAH